MLTILYYIHETGRNPGNSGIQRVVRNLGHALQHREDVELVPVRWDHTKQAIVNAEEDFFERAALFGGPVFKPAGIGGSPVHLTLTDEQKRLAVLLVAENPLLTDLDPRFPFVHAPFLNGYARRYGLRVAYVLHDLFPITDFGREDSQDVESMKFFIYAGGLASADVVFPVSSASADKFAAWMQRTGAVGSGRPAVTPLLLPEEMIGQPRGVCLSETVPGKNGGQLEFCMWGTIFPHKNQVAVMEAFNLLQRRRPDLDLVLHNIGNVSDQMIGRVGRLVHQSAGRIRMHGFVSDSDLIDIVSRCRSTLFVSLVEGYGLPLAESLWLGKPCLTSDRAPMAEIAEGGGCLLVDPTDVQAIAGAIERLATDDALIAKLDQEVRVREFRNWMGYAEQLAAILADVPAGANFPPVAVATPRVGCAVGDRQPFIETITIEPVEMVVPDAYASVSPALIVDGILSFDLADHGFVPEQTFLYGPYSRIERGQYRCYLRGEMQGSVRIKVTADSGRETLADMVVVNFDTPIDFFVSRAMPGFEIVLTRTDRTELLTVSVIEIDRYDADRIGNIRKSRRLRPFVAA